jgi:hypothetical protein
LFWGKALTAFRVTVFSAAINGTGPEIKMKETNTRPNNHFILIILDIFFSSLLYPFTLLSMKRGSMRGFIRLNP